MGERREERVARAKRGRERNAGWIKARGQSVPASRMNDRFKL